MNGIVAGTGFCSVRFGFGSAWVSVRYSIFVRRNFRFGVQILKGLRVQFGVQFATGFVVLIKVQGSVWSSTRY